MSVAVVMVQGYYSGYLLKRSNRDPCLWRRRWCILGEDKVWYMKRKDQGKQVSGCCCSFLEQVIEES